MLKQKQGRNITSGNLFKGIVTYAIPLFLSALIQTLFTAADTAVVGNFADSIAVASIGAGNPVISLLINGFVGFASGASIIISHEIGAGNKEAVKKSVDTAMIFALILGLAITGFAFSLAVPILNMMDCPQECFDSAVLYMKLYMLGTPFMMIYNFAAAIIRAEGDSTRPLVYIIISGTVNVVTNVILCLILPNKVAAVAIATVLSQVVSATLSVVRLITKKEGICRLNLRTIRFHGKSMGEIVRYGIPLAAATVVYPLANMQIQPAINSYGAANLAGCTAATNLDGLTNCLHSAFGATCVTFVSQNLGAKNRKRVEKTILICTACSFVSGLVLGTGATYGFAEELLGLFLPGEAESIQYGFKRMQYVNAFMWISAINGCIGGSLQAFGYPTFSTLNGLVSVLGFRIVWMNVFYARNPNIDMLYVCYTISWTINLLINLTLFFFVFKKYRRREKLREQREQEKPETA